MERERGAGVVWVVGGGRRGWDEAREVTWGPQRLLRGWELQIWRWHHGKALHPPLNRKDNIVAPSFKMHL